MVQLIREYLLMDISMDKENIFGPIKKHFIKGNGKMM